MQPRDQVLLKHSTPFIPQARLMQLSLFIFNGIVHSPPDVLAPILYSQRQFASTQVGGPISVYDLAGFVRFIWRVGFRDPSATVRYFQLLPRLEFTGERKRCYRTVRFPFGGKAVQFQNILLFYQTSRGKAQIYLFQRFPYALISRISFPFQLKYLLNSMCLRRFIYSLALYMAAVSVYHRRHGDVITIQLVQAFAIKASNQLGSRKFPGISVL